MKFKKKPVIIEAFKVKDILDAAGKDWYTLPKCIRDSYEEGKFLFKSNAIDIWTLEGTMTGNIDDWIIKGVKGEYYPCKPDIFEITYEPIYENE